MTLKAAASPPSNEQTHSLIVSDTSSLIHSPLNISSNSQHAKNSNCLSFHNLCRRWPPWRNKHACVCIDRIYLLHFTKLWSEQACPDSYVQTLSLFFSLSIHRRVSLTDYTGATIFDYFVAPTTPVVDFRTRSTGLTEAYVNLPNIVKFEIIQQMVAERLRGSIIVGHSLWQSLSVLGIPHPAVDTRDVALYVPFRTVLSSPNTIVGLPTLIYHFMCHSLEDTYPDSLENARAGLDLYRSRASEWERSISIGQWPCVLPPSTFSRFYL